MSHEARHARSGHDGAERGGRQRGLRANAGSRAEILAGQRLATVEELLRGYPFACDDMTKDSQEFARVVEEWSANLPDRSLADLLRPALHGLAVVCTLRTVGDLADVLNTAFRTTPHPELLGSFFRCRIYLAHLGSRDDAVLVATDAIRIAAAQDWDGEQDGLDIVWQGLAWLRHFASLHSRTLGGETLEEEPNGIAYLVREHALQFECNVRRLVTKSNSYPVVPSGDSPPT